MKEMRRLKLQLTTKEPFRIGALKDVMSVIDNPVATIGGRAVIQGSSLKGALRANIEEYLIEKFPDDNNMKPCVPASMNTLSDDEKSLISAGKYKPGGACHYSVRNKSTAICPACYLLGANGLMGFVRVPYLYTDRTPEELYSVRIDRGTGVVSERTNRDYQIMADEIVFEGVLEILINDPRRNWILGQKRPIGLSDKNFQGDKWLETNSWSSEKIIKELIIERLESISLLGGFKSKGCGKVKIMVSEKK